jgi:hypothetical protein
MVPGTCDLILARREEDLSNPVVSVQPGPTHLGMTEALIMGAHRA